MLLLDCFVNAVAAVTPLLGTSPRQEQHDARQQRDKHDGERHGLPSSLSGQRMWSASASTASATGSIHHWMLHNDLMIVSMSIVI